MVRRTMRTGGVRSRFLRRGSATKGNTMSEKKFNEPSRRGLLKGALIALGASVIVQPNGGVWAAEGEDDKKKKKKKKKDKPE